MKTKHNNGGGVMIIDITGVEYLTVHFCSTDTNWIIADDIMLIK